VLEKYNWKNECEKSVKMYKIAFSKNGSKNKSGSALPIDTLIEKCKNKEVTMTKVPTRITAKSRKKAKTKTQE